MRRGRQCAWLAWIVTCVGIPGSVSADIKIVGLSYVGHFSHIDAKTGETTVKNHLPAKMHALAKAPTGMLYAVNEQFLFEVDPATGNYRCLSELHLPVVDGKPHHVHALACTPSGTILASIGWTGPGHPDQLGIVDARTGSFRPIGDFHGGRTRVYGLAFAPDGRLYGISPDSRPGSKHFFVRIDEDTAAVNVIGHHGPAAESARVSGSIAFTSDGRLFAGGNDGVAELNPIDGSIIGTFHEVSVPPLHAIEILTEERTSANSTETAESPASNSNGQQHNLAPERRCPSCGAAMICTDHVTRDAIVDKGGLSRDGSVHKSKLVYRCTCGTQVTVTHRVVAEKNRPQRHVAPPLQPLTPTRVPSNGPVRPGRTRPRRANGMTD